MNLKGSTNLHIEEKTMKFAKRNLTDPYYGRGRGFLMVTDKASYEVDGCIGLSRNLFEVQLEITPPFDHESINSGGDYENVGDLKTISAKVALFWIQVSISFYISR